MSFRRKVALTLACILVMLLATAALVPFLFRDKIEARVKDAASANINARVDWQDLDIGLLRTFPHLSLRLHQLNITGVDAFAGDTLLGVPRFQVVIDLRSVLGGLRGEKPLVIRSVALERPQVHLLVKPDGSANWNIMRPRADTTASGRSLDVSLKKLSITDALITFDNEAADVHSRLAGLDHSLSGDFGKQQFGLVTQTTIDTAWVRFAGIPYLSNAKIEADVALDVDLAQKRFVLTDNRVRVNALELKTEGVVAGDGDDLALDLQLAAPRTEFREILSLVPAVYARDFANVQTTGAMTLQGRIQGRYGRQTFPAFELVAKVDNASFRYPDLPLPARDIALDLMLRNPGGDVDSTVVDLRRFHVVLGDDAVEGSLVMRTPKSDPDVDVRVAGRVDLANVPRTIKLENVERLAGTIAANAAMRARLSDVNAKRYDRVSASGRIEVQQLELNASNLRQPVNIHEAVLTLTPRYAELTSFRGRAGSSDVTMKGSLENVLGFALGREELRGSATLASRSFDLNEWRSGGELKEIVVPANIDFSLQADADTVKFGTLALRNAKGSLHIKDQRVTLEDFSMNLLGGAMKMKGYYETPPNTRPAFDMALDLTGINPAAAFAALKTVQAFAPIAKYAEGSVDAEVKLTGELGSDMMPVLENLSGLGSLLTSGLVLREFPPLNRLADALKLQQLRNPGFVDLKSSFAIEKGRLHVKPFDVKAGPLNMTVSGSNGIDQSLDYTLALRVPRSLLGGEAGQAITSIINRGQQVGFNLQAAEAITLGVNIGGTVTNPSVSTSFRDAAGDAGASVAQALREEAERRQEAVVERVDSAAEAARQRALAEAEARAAQIREEAQALADKLRAEAYQRADSLEARASGVAKIAARAAADKVRKEADAKADALVKEADERANALVAEARQRAQLTEQ